MRRQYDETNMEEGQTLVDTSRSDPLILYPDAVCIPDRLCADGIHGADTSAAKLYSGNPDL